MIIDKEFLLQANTRDLVFHSLLTMGAFAVAISSIIDLRKLKNRDSKNKTFIIFYILSSLIFIFATVYRLIFMLIA